MININEYLTQQNIVIALVVVIVVYLLWKNFYSQENLPSSESASESPSESASESPSGSASESAFDKIKNFFTGFGKRGGQQKKKMTRAEENAREENKSREEDREYRKVLNLSSP
jgi:hypothetical protein